MTPANKKWAIGLGIVATVGVVGYFTKDHWMPIFKKEEAKIKEDVTKEKPMANVTTTVSKAVEQKKSGFVYPKRNDYKNFAGASTLDNKMSFDAGRFNVVELSNSGDGFGINVSKTAKP